MTSSACGPGQYRAPDPQGPVLDRVPVGHRTGLRGVGPIGALSGVLFSSLAAGVLVTGAGALAAVWLAAARMQPSSATGPITTTSTSHSAGACATA